MIWRTGSQQAASTNRAKYHCQVANCRAKLHKGVICDEHWKEVPGWLRRQIALERDALKAAGVHNPNAAPSMCALYRKALAEVNRKHVDSAPAYPYHTAGA